MIESWKATLDLAGLSLYVPVRPTYVGCRKMRPETNLSLAPVSWLTALVRDSEHGHSVALNLVMDRVREVAENMSPDCILVFRPHQRIYGKSINRLERFGSKSIRGDRAALEVPEEGLADFCLCVGQNLYYEVGHKALSRALASAQDSALTVPARSAACRALISRRQASVIEESSLPSRLSSSATVKAERSSAGKPSASSRMWSTWSFMHRSLAFIQQNESGHCGESREKWGHGFLSSRKACQSLCDKGIIEDRSHGRAFESGIVKPWSVPKA